MNLIAFSRSRNCVNTQYAALSGAMVNIDWLSITTEPISITLTYAMLSGQAKLKVQMCGRRKLDKLLDTFQSFNLNIGVTQS